ncbi:epsin-3-like isoform X2 [Brienomyrus brachyistius]|uniref:epsin-3-like isoform X2 n=1 Tax=Brienomyrus brachyistius TaxID=42636 RepID=UPI0020B185E2|nr:epsin-3-like isoform X2 [Brienomyrus brachyistius]
MTTSSLRRQVKNIVHNYTEAEVKVREATSNDPWGPSNALMSEIADLTYSMPAFAEVMGIIWKRLSDHGKNWRHVHKALILLDYLVKTGSEQVAQQCRQNMVMIQALREFQYVDRDGRDHGSYVREKATQVTGLIRDSERLQRERAEALLARGHVAGPVVHMGARELPPPYPGRHNRQPSMSAVYREEFGRSRASPSSGNSFPSPSRASSDLEQARPQSSGEEELQLQVALALSREESEKPQPAVDSDEQAQLEMALRLSKENHKPVLPPPVALDIDEDTQLQIALSLSEAEHQQCHSTFADEVDIFGPSSAHAPSADLWDQRTGNSQPASQTHSDPWDILEPCSSTSAIPKPWVAPPASDTSVLSIGPKLSTTDPWEPPKSSPCVQPTGQVGAFPVQTGSSSVDPFSALSEESPVANSHHALSAYRPGSPTDGDLFGEPKEDEELNNKGAGSQEPLDLSQVAKALPDPSPRAGCNPESFLGPVGASLVDLDNLIPSGAPAKVKNPFFTGPKDPSNPFHSHQARQTASQIRPGLASLQPLAASHPPHAAPLSLSQQPHTLHLPYTQPPAFPVTRAFPDMPDDRPRSLLPFSAAPPAEEQRQNPFL